MRKLATLTVLVIAVLFSMASATQPQQQGYGGGYGQPGQDPTGCDVACNHYFQCRGIQDQNAFVQCIQGCQQQNPDPQTMYQYAQLDCGTVIAIVEQQGGGGMGGGAGAGGYGGASAGGPRPGDQECNGCKRWDDMCSYVVETAVGSGPYSGAVTDCPQSCCP